MSFLFYTTIVTFLIVCLFLILLVLIQKGRGGGLASAFGGGGGNTAFGSKTGDVLTWATSIVFGIFLLLGIALNLLADRVNRPRSAAAPVAASTVPPTTPGSAIPPSIPSDPGIPATATQPSNRP